MLASDLKLSSYKSLSNRPQIQILACSPWYEHTIALNLSSYKSLSSRPQPRRDLASCLRGHSRPILSRTLKTGHLDLTRLSQEPSRAVPSWQYRVVRQVLKPIFHHQNILKHVFKNSSFGFLATANRLKGSWLKTGFNFPFPHSPSF